MGASSSRHGLSERWPPIGMKGQGIALVAGATAVAGFDPIRQQNDFYYLCGVKVPHAYLILNAEKGTATLYLNPKDASTKPARGRNCRRRMGHSARRAVVWTKSNRSRNWWRI